MKVLHVIPSVSAVHGGPSKAVVMMERALAACGAEVWVATTNDDGTSSLLTVPLGTPVPDGHGHRIYFKKWFNFYKIAPGFAWWVLRNIQGFDVVHIHALFSFTSLVAALAARWRGVPYVIRPLGTLSAYGVTRRRPLLKRVSMALFERGILECAAAVHFTSQAELDEAAALGLSMHGVVIPLGIEAAEPANFVALNALFPQLSGCRYVLFLSRLDPKKNAEGLLRAFSLSGHQWPDAKLLVAGSGDTSYVAGLKSLAEELGLVDRVVWAGRVDGDLKADVLAGAELFVLPSFSENFGIAAVEALMAGLPCVLGRGVAIAQEIEAAGAGLSVAPEPAAIATGIGQVMMDPLTRAKMAARAVVLAQHTYSIQAMGINLVRLYRSILKQ